MSAGRAVSIRVKLISMMLLTAAVALVVITAAMAVYEFRAHTDLRVQDIATQTELLGAASTGALTFQDPIAAAENLQVLRVRPRVTSAALYDADGELFATYVRGGGVAAFPPRPGPEGVTIESDHLSAFHRVVHDADFLGTAYVRAEFDRRERVAGYLAIAGLATVAALLAALVFALRLQRLITHPIMLINRAARDVVDRREYTLRAEKVTDDEVGLLADSFNLMLDEIHARTTALVETNQTLERENAARLEAQAELHKLNRELERRIGERTAELERSNEELESFSYTVSHDLRSPLRAITGFAQALKSRLPAPLDPESEAYFERIRNAIRRMGQRIDALLNLAHLSRRELNRQRVDLGEYAAEAVAELQQRDPGRLVDVSIRGDLEVNGDAKLLRALMDNLIENAWKFTEPAMQARVEVGVREAEDGRVFFVRDNGAGFDMRFADKLFQPFQRVHAVSEFPGTGIGLATVKRIVERHGGRIWADAAPGDGAVFYFTLDERGER